MGLNNPNWPVIIKNLSNSQYPILQRESIRQIENSLSHKNGIHFLIRQLNEIDRTESIDLVKKFSSLPDLIPIIVCRDDKSDYHFDLDEFFRATIEDLIQSIPIDENRDYYRIAADLLSNFFVKGHSVTICRIIDRKFRENQLTIETTCRIVDEISVKHIDRVIIGLVESITCCEAIDLLIRSVRNANFDTNLSFLCRKMLFYRFYECDFVAVNVGSLIYRLEEQERLSILRELLIVWADERSLLGISFDQRFYLTKMILIVFNRVSLDARQNFFIGDNLSLFLRAISLHLSQPIHNYRLLGMVVGEILAKYCSGCPVDCSLKFDYVDTDETKTLKKLANIEICELKIERKEEQDGLLIEGEQKEDEEEDGFQVIPSIFDEEKSVIKRPFFVRDCFEGLTKTKPEEMDYFQVCLENVEDLIVSCPETSVEECLEYSRLLLHLHIECELEEFSTNQKRGLVALCCLAPVKVSTYLIGEFFHDQNSLGTRYIVLHTLTAAAQKLSGFNEFLQPAEKIVLSKPEPDKSPARKNTRYFFSWKSNKQSPVETRNLFNESATYFFYPLLAGVHNNGGDDGHRFDVLSGDYDLLCRFVYTLGIIVYCSMHATGIVGIVREYFGFLRSLRTHNQVCVRRAVQVCLGVAFVGLSGASGVSIDELIDCLVDWQLWLRTASEIVTFELDSDCCSLIEKNIFLLKDLVESVTPSLLIL